MSFSFSSAVDAARDTDPRHRLPLSQVNAAISKILESKEITVILVAHRLSSIAQADRVVLIEHGEVVEDGKYDELVRHERAARRRGLVLY